MGCFGWSKPAKKRSGSRTLPTLKVLQRTVKIEGATDRNFFIASAIISSTARVVLSEVVNGSIALFLAAHIFTTRSFLINLVSIRSKLSYVFTLHYRSCLNCA